MFTTEELRLLEAIHADPKNDAPRLEYATWLEGRGNPQQADFILLQFQKPYFRLERPAPV